MADLTDITSKIPSTEAVKGFFSSTFNVITIFVVVVVLMILCGVLVYFWLSGRKFRYRIVIFEKSGNNWEMVGRDRAMEMKYGMAGDTVFYLKKRRKYLPRPELQTGRRIYWYAIREDGEWINITIGDIDTQMKKMNARYLHPEMRYARTALLRNLRDRYDKPKFLEKYGMMLINIAAIAVILIFMWLIIDKIMSVAGSLDSAVKSSTALQETNRDIVQSIDHLCSGSGIKGG